MTPDKKAAARRERKRRANLRDFARRVAGLAGLPEGEQRVLDALLVAVPGDVRDSIADHGTDPAVHSPIVAALLGVETQTLRKWRCTGKGPELLRYIQTGAAVRYPLSAVLAHRIKHTYQHTGEAQAA